MGEMIKNRREQLRMTQDELAKKSGLSRQTISSIENGKCEDVLVSTLVAIANALDTTVDSFLYPDRPNVLTNPLSLLGIPTPKPIELP